MKIICSELLEKSMIDTIIQSKEAFCCWFRVVG